MRDFSDVARSEFRSVQISEANRREDGSLAARGWLYVAAILWTVALIYSSLIPFHFARQDIPARLAEMAASTPWEPGSGFDWTINILAAVPLGLLWSAVRIPPRLGHSFGIAAGCGVFALVIEVLQIWLPLRVPSIRDVLALTIGAALGCGWWRVCRSPVLCSADSVSKSCATTSCTSSLIIRGVGACGILTLLGWSLAFGLEPAHWFEMYRCRSLHPPDSNPALTGTDSVWLTVIPVVTLMVCMALVGKRRLSLHRPNLRDLSSPAGQIQGQSGTIADWPSESGLPASNLRRAA